MLSIAFWTTHPYYTKILCRMGSGDIVCNSITLTSCDQFCDYFEAGNIVDNNYPGSYPHYGRCYNESDGPLPNKVRMAFPSQIATIDQDPALPPLNEPNMTSCRRMSGEYYRELR